VGLGRTSPLFFMCIRVIAAAHKRKSARRCPTMPDIITDARAAVCGAMAGDRRIAFDRNSRPLPPPMCINQNFSTVLLTRMECGVTLCA